MNEQSFTLRDSSKGVVRAVIVDILSLFVVYYIPTISHHLIFPLYMLDPMRIVVFACILLSGSRINSYIFAITIPFFSYFVGGHPVLLKSFIIGMELLVNMMLFWSLIRKWQNVFVVTFVSIIVAKVIYYITKIFVVEIGWLQMDIISTPFYVQGLVALAISVLMSSLFKK